MADWSPYEERGARPNGGAKGPWFFALIALGVLAALATWQLTRRGEALHDPDAAPRPITPRGDLTASEQTTIEIFKAASPSVVHITNYKVGRRQFRTNPMAIEQGTGTGFVWDARGYIVTNYHVVAGGQRWRVTLHGCSIRIFQPVGKDHFK